MDNFRKALSRNFGTKPKIELTFSINLPSPLLHHFYLHDKIVNFLRGKVNPQTQNTPGFRLALGPVPSRALSVPHTSHQLLCIFGNRVGRSLDQLPCLRILRFMTDQDVCRQYLLSVIQFIRPTLLRKNTQDFSV